MSNVTTDLYSKLLYELGQDFLEVQNTHSLSFFLYFLSPFLIFVSPSLALSLSPPHIFSLALFRPFSLSLSLSLFHTYTHNQHTPLWHMIVFGFPELRAIQSPGLQGVGQISGRMHISGFIPITFSILLCLSVILSRYLFFLPLYLFYLSLYIYFLLGASRGWSNICQNAYTRVYTNYFLYPSLSVCLSIYVFLFSSLYLFFLYLYNSFFIYGLQGVGQISARMHISGFIPITFSILLCLSVILSRYLFFLPLYLFYLSLYISLSFTTRGWSNIARMHIAGFIPITFSILLCLSVCLSRNLFFLSLCLFFLFYIFLSLSLQGVGQISARMHISGFIPITFSIAYYLSVYLSLYPREG